MKPSSRRRRRVSSAAIFTNVAMGIAVRKVNSTQSFIGTTDATGIRELPQKRWFIPNTARRIIMGNQTNQNTPNPNSPNNPQEGREDQTRKTAPTDKDNTDRQNQDNQRQGQGQDNQRTQR